MCLARWSHTHYWMTMAGANSTHPGLSFSPSLSRIHSPFQCLRLTQKSNTNMHTYIHLVSVCTFMLHLLLVKMAHIRHLYTFLYTSLLQYHWNFIRIFFLWFTHFIIITLVTNSIRHLPRKSRCVSVKKKERKTDRNWVSGCRILSPFTRLCFTFIL